MYIAKVETIFYSILIPSCAIIHAKNSYNKRTTRFTTSTRAENVERIFFLQIKDDAKKNKKSVGVVATTTNKKNNENGKKEERPASPVCNGIKEIS